MSMPERMVYDNIFTATQMNGVGWDDLVDAIGLLKQGGWTDFEFRCCGDRLGLWGERPLSCSESARRGALLYIIESIDRKKELGGRVSERRP